MERMGRECREGGRMEVGSWGRGREGEGGEREARPHGAGHWANKQVSRTQRPGKKGRRASCRMP
jgi:hypothetical protein